jgi:hypothetical protein
MSRTTAFQNHYPCRYDAYAGPCPVASVYFAKDNRAKYGHLCWKHPPKSVDDDPEYYTEVPL